MLNLLERFTTDEDDDQRALLGPFQAVAFWIAIALPFVQVPVLATDLATAAGLEVVVVLLATNCLALLVGHGYRR